MNNQAPMHVFSELTDLADQENGLVVLYNAFIALPQFATQPDLLRKRLQDYGLKLQKGEREGLLIHSPCLHNGDERLVYGAVIWEPAGGEDSEARWMFRTDYPGFTVHLTDYAKSISPETRKIWEENTVYGDWIGVDPEYQKLGYAKLLGEECIARANADGKSFALSSSVKEVWPVYERIGMKCLSDSVEDQSGKAWKVYIAPYKPERHEGNSVIRTSS